MKRPYLLPYLRAHRQRATGVDALLWEDQQAQDVRFEAIARSCPLSGLHVLDVGCGRADLLGYLRTRGIRPAYYTGVEAQPWLARAARRRRYPNCSLVVFDFVREPAKLAVGADAVVFSGSLNFLSSRPFYRVLDAAWASTQKWLVFNFLCSRALTAAEGLAWHRQDAVVAFARARTPSVRVVEGYEDGDCTVVMEKSR